MKLRKIPPPRVIRERIRRNYLMRHPHYREQLVVIGRDALKKRGKDGGEAEALALVVVNAILPYIKTERRK